MNIYTYVLTELCKRSLHACKEKENGLGGTLGEFHLVTTTIRRVLPLRAKIWRAGGGGSLQAFKATKNSCISYSDSKDTCMHINYKFVFSIACAF